MTSVLNNDTIQRMLLEHSNDLISLHDAEGRYLYASPACERLLGYEADELVGRQAYELFHPDDIPAITRHHQENYNNPDHPPVVYRIRCKDGRYTWFETSSREVPDPEGPGTVLAVSRDVSERVAVEQEMQRHSEVYRTLAANIPNGAAYVFDLNSRILLAEGSSIRAAGFDPQQLIGATPAEVLPDDVARTISAGYEAALNGEPRSFTFEYADRVFSAHTAPLRDKDGVITGGIALTQDVTEQRLAEQRLATSEALFRKAFTTATHGMAIVAPDGTIEQVNPAICEMLGYDADEFAALGLDGITHPPDLDKDLAQLQKLVAGDIPHYTLEKRYRHKDGHVLWGLLSVALVRDPDGSPRHVIGQVLDITERKQFEQSLARATDEWERTFEAVPDMIMLLDVDGAVKRVNRTLAERVGRRPVDMIGKTCADLFGEETEEKICLLRDTGREAVELRIEALGGWFAVTSNPLLTVEGERIGTVQVAHDITERKRMEAAMLDRGRLEATTVLAGGFAHDINNMMSVILGNSELIDKYGEVSAERVRTIRDAAEKVAEIAEELTAFARIGHYNPRRLSLNHVIEDAISAISHTLPDGVQVTSLLRADPDSLVGDSARLQQLLHHLLRNAGEALGGSVGDVYISTALLDDLPTSVIRDEPRERHDDGDSAAGPAADPDGWLRLTVRDEGCGMSADTLRRAFDPFFTTHEAGRGMGLAAVYGIVDAHDGHIELESVPGLGTTVHVYFPATPDPLLEEPSPASKAPTGDAAPARNEESNGSGTVKPTDGVTVLVVDDEDGIREMLEILLKSLGYTVLCASNGKEAVDLVAEQGEQVDLVLLDLLMPVMDGHTAFRHLRELRPGLPVVLVSGYERDATVQQLIEQGAAAFVHKPFELDELVGCVQTALAGG